MTKTERLREQGIKVDNCKNYVWYKVYYHIYLGGKQYVTFDYCLNTAENPHNIENMVEKLGSDFVAVTEWDI